MKGVLELLVNCFQRAVNLNLVRYNFFRSSLLLKHSLDRKSKSVITGAHWSDSSTTTGRVLREDLLIFSDAIFWVARHGKWHFSPQTFKGSHFGHFCIF